LGTRLKFLVTECFVTVRQSLVLNQTGGLSNASFVGTKTCQVFELFSSKSSKKRIANKMLPMLTENTLKSYISFK